MRRLAASKAHVIAASKASHAHSRVRNGTHGCLQVLIGVHPDSPVPTASAQCVRRSAADGASRGSANPSFSGEARPRVSTVSSNVPPEGRLRAESAFGYQFAASEELPPVELRSPRATTASPPHPDPEVVKTV